MTEIDLDEVVDSVLVWDHRVKVGGKSYATRPATIGELAMLEDAAKGKRGMSDLVGVIAGLFERVDKRRADGDVGVPGVPDVGAWSTAKLKAFVNGYMRFFGQWQNPGVAGTMPAAIPARRETSVSGG